jgi:hypothetical protein
MRGIEVKLYRGSERLDCSAAIAAVARLVGGGAGGVLRSLGGRVRCGGSRLPEFLRRVAGSDVLRRLAQLAGQVGLAGTVSAGRRLRREG